ncbi:hypothetical protein ACFQPA_22035 [Halomarina halobia]|uniref:DUF8006 domain-containing protein n=1 Tax=Halomarina halobia TaxID=3033386 RepID=A0ABD6A7S9_9EURY|nr:hypothetical protein [Halomarina sp. PSR21]
MLTLPLQVIDSFLLQYNIGQVFLLLLVVGLLATLPMKSKTIVGAHIVLIGLLLVLTPLSLMDNDFIYRAIGLALVFIGPMVMVVGR